MTEHAAVPLFANLKIWDDRGEGRRGAVNMAIDEALLGESGRIRTPVLRFYCWDRPTLSFGYFIPLAVASASCRVGESMVRRWTGGGLVHHDSATTWSLAVPMTDAFCRLRPTDAYTQLHAVLARCLAAEGMTSIQLVSETHPTVPGGNCAEVPALGDLLWRGNKLAGAGQRRTRQGLLHQAAIFWTASQRLEQFPEFFAPSIAKQTSQFSVPVDWRLPVARYEDPAWIARF